jgi:hypothetical protein
VFAALRAAGGKFASIAVGAVHDRVVCVNLVATDPAQRRKGLPRRLGGAPPGGRQERAGHRDLSVTGPYEGALSRSLSAPSG